MLVPASRRGDGADVNLATDAGVTPLMVANNSQIALALRTAGAKR